MGDEERLGFGGRVGLVVAFMSSPAIVRLLLTLIAFVAFAAAIISLEKCGACTGGVSAGVLFLAAAYALGQLRKA